MTARIRRSQDISRVALSCARVAHESSRFYLFICLFIRNLFSYLVPFGVFQPVWLLTTPHPMDVFVG